MRETERWEVLRSLERRELALMRALQRDPGLLDARGEAAVRTAIGLARLHTLETPDGPLEVEPLVLELRDETLKLLEVAGIRERDAEPAPEKLRPIATILRGNALRTRAALLAGFSGRLDPEALDREVRVRALVLALGGGGGSGYAYLGAFKALEEWGLCPALIAGTSMGAVLGLFRARTLRYDTAELLSVVRSLSWGRLFQLLSMDSRYGLPAALRLYLRAALGRFFLDEEGEPLRLDGLPIPLVTCVSGIRAGMLPRPLEFYEGLLGDVRGLANPARLARRIPVIAAALAELVQVSERLDGVQLGVDPGTESFDVLDAVGFSSALPGVIHYDVVRDDARMIGLLDALMRRRELFRLADGGLVDNVPARVAWQAVQRGRIGTRNALVVALDGFAPKLSAPMWLPLQGLVVAQVAASCGWAHLYKPMRATLSPLELVPGIGATLKMLERGRAELAPEMPLIQRLLQPLPPLAP